MDKVIIFMSNPYGAFLAGFAAGAASVAARFAWIALTRAGRAVRKSWNT